MIDILMATYNGANFLENQLLSLISQTNKEWRLLVHDDGSSDSTIDIVKRYMSIDNRIILIEDGIVKGNAGQNFLHLLRYSTAQYVVFCDQDDIWFESKLQVLLNGFSEECIPEAVYCNAYAYNCEVITTNKVTTILRNTLSNSLFLNSGVQGCSLMFNRALIDKLREYPNYVYMHDHLLTMAAITFGKLIYIDKSLMLYRQHSNNVTGNISTSFYERLKVFSKRKNVIIDKKHYDANKSFYECYNKDMTLDQKKVFLAYLEFPRKGLIGKILSVLKYNFRIGNSKVILLIKIMFKKTM
ncbi:glycosyltransferase family 2 protein [Myroides odoratimimus]|uniref:glycosyltransferase family 2 protein n=1 Tax=Myroides odoratimimus TaxID=76832 RepID=UPI003D2F6A92